MPSPIAHVGLSLAAAAALLPRVGWRDAALVAFAAVLPDFDLLPDVIEGDGIHWHHGPTHSLVFALGAATALALVRRGPRGLTAALFVALLLHAPLDYTTGEPGAPAKYGVTWLWPLSDARFISPDPFFGAYHIDGDEGLGAMLVGAALPNYGREAGVVLAAGLVAAGIRRRR